MRARTLWVGRSWLSTWQRAAVPLRLALLAMVLAGGCVGSRPGAGTGRVDAAPTRDGSGGEAPPGHDGAVADAATPDGLATNDGGTPPACTVTAPGKEPPYPTEFLFRNDTTAPLFISAGAQCAGIDFGVSSCASGFRDRLGPVYACACPCDSTSCTGAVVCGPCPPPEALMIPAGQSLKVAWNAIVASTEQKTGTAGAPFMCVRETPLQAGRYRVAIRVFDDATSAVKYAGGRTVTRDFSLPAEPAGVDVPLSADALDI